MNSFIHLTEADQLRLQRLHAHQIPPPFPSPDQTLALAKLLLSVKVNESAESAGFYDQVTMVSPKDSSDYFKLTIVMPHESNPDQECISVLMPVALAILGKKAGDLASWEANGFARQMRIISVQKSALIAI